MNSANIKSLQAADKLMGSLYLHIGIIDHLQKTKKEYKK